MPGPKHSDVLLVLAIACLLLLPSSWAQSYPSTSTEDEVEALYKHRHHKHYHDEDDQPHKIKCADTGYEHERMGPNGPVCCLDFYGKAPCHEVLEHCLAADTPNDAAVIAKLIADIDNVDLTKADEVCALKKNWAALGADISSFDIVIVEPTTLTLSDGSTTNVSHSRAAIFTAKKTVYAIISQVYSEDIAPVDPKIPTEPYGRPESNMQVNSFMYQLYKAYVAKGLKYFIKEKADDATHIVLAGASAGTSVSQFLALGLHSHKVRAIYLEGANRLGNQAFQENYMEQFGLITYSWWNRVDPFPTMPSVPPYTSLPQQVWWRTLAGSGPSICQRATAETFQQCIALSTTLPCPVAPDDGSDFHSTNSYFCNIKKCVVTSDQCLSNLQLLKPMTPADIAAFC